MQEGKLAIECLREHLREPMEKVIEEEAQKLVANLMKSQAMEQMTVPPENHELLRKLLVIHTRNTVRMLAKIRIGELLADMILPPPTR